MLVAKGPWPEKRPSRLILPTLDVVVRTQSFRRLTKRSCSVRFGARWGCRPVSVECQRWRQAQLYIKAFAGEIRTRSCICGFIWPFGRGCRYADTNHSSARPLCQSAMWQPVRRKRVFRHPPKHRADIGAWCGPAIEVGVIQKTTIGHSVGGRRMGIRL